MPGSDSTETGRSPLLFLGAGLPTIFLALVLFGRESSLALVLQKVQPWNLSSYSALKWILCLKYFLLFAGLSLSSGAFLWKPVFGRLLTGDPFRQIPERGLFWWILPTTLLLYVALELVVFQRFLFTPDEFAYLYQARLFASGQMTAPAHPLQEFFATAFIANSHGRLFSMMPPGYSLFLVPWVWLGCPWLANPVLSACNVLLAWRLGARLYDRTTGLTAALLMALSPFFLFQTGGHMTHPLSLFLVLIAVYVYCVLQENKMPGWGICVLFGLILALLPTVHHFDVFILLPLMFVLGARFLRGPNPLRARIFLIGAVFLASQILFILWYNSSLTGSAWKFPVDVYMEHENFLGKLSHGIPEDGAMVGISSPRELFRHLSRLGIQIFHLNLVLFPLAPFFMICPLFSSHCSRWDTFLAACLGTMATAYLFYRPWGGFQLGPRYYYLGVAFMYFLILRAFVFLYRWWGCGSPNLGGATRNVWSLVFFLVFCYQVAVSAGLLSIVRNLFDEWKPVKEVGRWFERRGINDSIIFLRTSEKEQERDPEFIYLLIRNQPGFSDSNLTARDLGRENLKLMDFYRDRRYFLYEVDRQALFKGEPMRWAEIHREDYLPNGRDGPVLPKSEGSSESVP